MTTAASTALDLRRRGLFALLLRRARRGPGTVLPRHLRRRGAAAAGQHLLQELGDDRLARRLAAGAQGAGARHRAHHPGTTPAARRPSCSAAASRRSTSARISSPRRWRRPAPIATSWCGCWADMPRVRFEVPMGAFYLFFAIDGMTDSSRTTCASSTRPRSASHRAPHSARAARVICACATCVIRRKSKRPLAGLARG